MNLCQINNLLSQAKEHHKKHPYLRVGQLFFNLLYEKYPMEATKIRGTHADPFYSDDNIKFCVQELSKLIINNYEATS